MATATDRPNGMPKLSVVNPHRKVLEGPTSLDQLVSSTSSQEIAIDYQNAHGERRKLSYATLKTYTKILSTRLSKLSDRMNIGNQIIPVVMPQCPELYISYLAILQSGAGFCPISHDTPAERLKFIVNDVKASIVLTTREYFDTVAPHLPDICCEIVSTRDLQLNQANLTDAHSFNSKFHNPTNIAYVMYTSGSTGLPKGVRISHRSATQSLLAHDEHLPKFKRFLQFASPTFDVSVFEIFFPLFRGVTLVSCDRERMLNDLTGTINSLCVDAAELTPTVASTLLRTRDAAPSLRLLLTIGEMLNRHVVDEFGESDEQEGILYAMYGPTEASIHCTIAPRLSANASIRNIGRPLSTVTVLILEEASDGEKPRILPTGKTGELALCGQLASGYLNRPEQTMTAFVDLPGYGQVYRTGDRAVLHESGDLHILGRISTGQVKLRGQRVELAEIEEVASKTAGLTVTMASVINDNLVLFCWGSDVLTSTEVQQVCKAWLPQFMRPGNVVVSRSEVPRLPSGKIDRKKVEQDYQEQQVTHESNNGDFKPGIEHDIALVISDELQIGLQPSTSLWSCGLDSLRAIRVASRLRSLFPSISVPLILESETVGDLILGLQKSCSAAVDSRSSSSLFEDGPDWPSFEASVRKDLEHQTSFHDIEKILPCSPMQIAMLLETDLTPKANYNTIKFSCAKPFPQREILRAFSMIAEGNEILRSGFVSCGNSRMPFVQLVWNVLPEVREPSLLCPLAIRSQSLETNCEIILSIHHALYDGWSLDIIIEELELALSGQTLTERVQFHDYSRHQRVEMKIQGKTNLEYWTEALRNMRLTSFPTLCSEVLSSAPRQRHELRLTVTESTVARAARRLHVSRQTFFQAALGLLLGAYFGSDDFIMGNVSSGREMTMRGIEGVIGPCLSTLPLRIQLDAVRTSNDLLFHLQRLQLESLKHGRVNLADIKRMAGFGPTQSFFDVLFVWQESLITNNGGHSLIEVKDQQDNLNYPLVVEAEPVADQIFIRLTTESSKIPEAHGKLLLQQLQAVVSILVEQQDVVVQDVWSTLTNSMLSLSNSQVPSGPSTIDMTASIRHISQHDPSRMAVEFAVDHDPITEKMSIETLSYGDLYHRAKNIASNLVAQYGVQRNDLIAVWSSKSIDLYVTICAIILSGAGYMCIDPRTPDGRVAQIFREARCKVIIVNEANGIKQMQEIDSPIVTFRSLALQPTENVHLPMSASETDLAYTIFTSGSTGVPKGVQIARANIMSNIECLAKIYPFNPGSDRLLQTCSQAFDVSVFEIFWTWHCGMTLCSANNDILFRDLEKITDQFGVTHLSLTPSVAALVDPVKVPKVKLLVTAGEPMNTKVYQMWGEHGLYQGYGPSETTNICNVQKVSPRVPTNNVGAAFSNTSIFVCAKRNIDCEKEKRPLSLDDFQLLPRGAVGEVWIGGQQVGRGYIDQKLTAQHWFTHPDFGRLYRSGDLGRLLEDESLVILGRLDDQVKLRGQRIELGDINSTLIHDLHVQEAHTVIIEDEKTDKLVVFWTSQDEQKVSFPDIVNSFFDELEVKLPSYMIPDYLVPVHQIPLTRQSKVDKAALVNHYRSMTAAERGKCTRMHAATDDCEALSERQMIFAEALSEVTGTPKSEIGGKTSFYSLGLDSISAIAFSKRLRDKGIDLVDVSIILQNPSIEKLSAQALSNPMNRKHSQKDPRNAFPQEWKDKITLSYANLGYQVQEILPCTPLQEAMLSSTTGADSMAYQNHLKFAIAVPTKVVQNAWTYIIERNDLLRTCFVPTEDEDKTHCSVVLKNFKPPWTADMNKPASQPESQPLPPYHFLFERSHQGKNFLHLYIHHALYDAKAMEILLKEVELFVQGLKLKDSVPFSQYLSYMYNIDSNRSNEFWRPRLAEVQPCRMMDRIANKAYCQSQKITVSESSLLMYDFDERLRGLSTTPQACLQAVVGRMLSQYFDSRDVCFGNVFSGRNLPLIGIDEMVGPCFNTLPVHVAFHDRMSNLELCFRLQTISADYIPFQPTSLRDLQKQYSPDGKSLFDFLLLLQFPSRRLDESVWTLLEDEGNMSFPFILEVVLAGPNVPIRFQLHHRLRDESIAQEILADFQNLLQHTLQFPQAAASSKCSLSLKLTAVPDQSLGPGRDEAPEEFLNTAEIEILGILCTLMKSRRNGFTRSTNIYQLGLDSISAVKAASELRKAGYNITAGDILESPTIQDIAEHCESHQTNHRNEQYFDLETYYESNLEPTISQLKIRKNHVEAIWPCTATQSGMLVQFMRSCGKLYCNSLRLKLSKEVDLERLRKAWATAMDTHAMLRTGFTELDDHEHPLAMIVYAPGAHELPWYVGRAKADRTERHEYGQDMLKDLKSPCWRLQVIPNDSTLELTILHALYDANSLQTIMNDVAAIYGQSIRSPVPSLTRGIGQILFGETSGNEFWQNAKLQPTLFPDLNTERSDSSESTKSLHRASFSYADIKAATEREAVSLQTIFQCVWARLIAAYTDQANVTFGILLSGRNFQDPSLNDLVFPCINTVPCGVEIMAETSSFLQQLSKLNASLTKYQRTPLTSIKRQLNVEGDLYDTILVVQDLRNVQHAEAPWNVIEDKAAAEFALSMEVVLRHDNTVQLQLTSRINVVPEQHASLILKQFDALSRQVIFDSKDKGDLPSDVLSIVNAKEDPISSPVYLLHELEEITAAQTPARIALEFVTATSGDVVSKECWTYSQLDAKANQIANLLQYRGAEPGDLVAVCFDKCPEASFSLLGVLKAGCGYVAIDPGAPTARKEFILEDAKCEIVLTSRGVLDLTNQSLQIVDMGDEELLEPYSFRKPNLKRHLNGDDTCYCLYTSGTTGTSKGCLISHNSAVQAMLSFQRIFAGHWNEKSRWLQFASFHFDVSVLEHFWSWSVGICVTSAPRDLLFEDLPGMIAKLEISHLDLTPSLARLLSPEDVPLLKEGVFIVGGEQVRQDILDVWGGTGALYNFYGPSEVTIGCTVNPQVSKMVKATNIGRPWDNVGALVLEPNSEKLVLRGAVGELCLYGSLVGKGYLNRPELTAEKFVKLERNGLRIYRTGDLVRLLHDDSFEFLGRNDDQIKLRGQRLETGEINRILMQAVDGIKDAATLVLKHPKLGKEMLVSFFSMASAKNVRGPPEVIHNENDVVEVIRQNATKHLPAYMIPTHILQVEFMPLTANNKTDSRMLKKVFEDDFSTKVGGENVNETDPKHYEGLVKVLARFFKIRPRDVLSNSRLFELGLDSISVIGLARALKSEGFHSVDVRTIMMSSTVAGLAKALQQEESIPNMSLQEIKEAQSRTEAFAEKHLDQVRRILEVKRNRVEHIAPCTPLQEGMISKVENSLGQPYFGRFEFSLKPDIDLLNLQSAWQTVQQQLAILRTFFISTSDGFAQVVLRSDDLPVRTILDTCSANKKLAEFDIWVKETKAFAERPPWRVQLQQEHSGNKMLLFMFHGIYDGISIQLLLDAVHRAYQGQNFIDGVPQFYDVLPYGPLLQRHDAESFWRQKLSVINLLGLGNEHGTSAILETTIVNNQIPELCGLLNVTTPAFFQAAWLLTLFECYGVNPTIGVVLSGRSITEVDAENVVGPMFNTLPYSINGLSSNAKLSDLIKACHDFSTEVIHFQHTPLRQIRKWINLRGDDQLFDSLFVFQKRQIAVCELGTNIKSESQADYPLNLEVVEMSNSTFHVKMVTNGREKAEWLLGRLEKTITEIIEDETNELPASFCHGEAAIPTTTTNKIDSSEHEQQEFWSESAKTIRRLLANLANVDEKDLRLRSPTIFKLGLDSIDALKLAARLKNEGLFIPTSKIMRYPTIAGIAEYVDTENSQPSLPSKITASQPLWRNILSTQGVHLENVEAILPVTAMQEGLLVDFEQYLHIHAFELRRGIDVAQLERAVEAVVAELPILRARFVAVDSTDVDDSFLLVVQKLTNNTLILSSKSAFPEILTKLRQDALRVFGPILKIAKLGNQQFLFMALPHATYDAWSMTLMHQRILQQYQKVASPPETLSIGDFLDATQVRNSDFEFWTEALNGCQSSLFPKDAGTPYLQEWASSVSFEEAQSTCNYLGITLQSLGLACWTLTLAHYTKQLDVSFGLVQSGRSIPGSDNLVFPTFNTVIFRPQIQLESGKSVLQNIHELVMDIVDHQHFPLREAIKLARMEFNTLFTFQKTPKVEEALYDEVKLDERLRPPYAVNVEMTVEDGCLMWTVAVQEGVLRKEGVEQLLQNMDSVLLYLVKSSEDRVIVRQNDLVSICGLAQIMLVKTEASNDVKEVEHSDWTDTELKVRDAFAAVSKTEEIGKTTSMFYIGLDSISAIKVSALLRKSGLKLPVSELIKAGTVQGVAAAIESYVAPTVGPVTKTEIKVSGIDPDHIEEVLPATGGQIYMLDMWRASGGRLFYASFWLTGNLRFDEMAVKVPSLRTTFVMEAGETYQVVIKANNMGRYSFPWAFKCDGKVTVLKIHHALYDAVSLGLILSQQGGVEFGPFIQRTQSGRRFWTEYLKSSRQTLQGSFEALRTELFVPNLMVLGKYDVSIPALFFAAWGQIVAPSCEEVIVGVYLANRSLDIEGLDQLVAPTFNIVPLKVRIGDLMTVAKEVQNDLQVISKAENCGVSLRDVYAWTRVKIDSYVNFLRVSEVNHAEGNALVEAKRLEVMERSPFHGIGIEQAVRRTEEQDWCLPAIDVEAKVDEEGRLGVGLFAPSDMMDQKEANGVLEKLAMVLRTAKNG